MNRGNRQFIARHRDRRQALANAERANAVLEPLPIYWALAHIATACGVSEHDLHYKFRPAFWGVPRDWNVVRGITLYRDEALPDLINQLAESGELAAAGKLRGWWQNQRKATETAPATTLAAEAKPNPEPISRLTQWERDHDL